MAKTSAAMKRGGEPRISASLQRHFDKENARVADLMKKREGSLQMDNGQILEKGTLKEFQSSLREAKANGELWSDYAYDILYNDGTQAHYTGGDTATENNRRNAGNAMNALQDMHTDAYRLLETDNQVLNAREAIEDVMWYSKTGRADIDFEGAIGSLTKGQQETFVKGLSEKPRSRDDNVKKAKQLIRKIKPNAGERKRQTETRQTEEQRRIAESVNREYQAARTAEQINRRYGR